MGAVTQGSYPAVRGQAPSLQTPGSSPNSPGLWCGENSSQVDFLPQGVPGALRIWFFPCRLLCMNPPDSPALRSLLPSASWASCAASLRSFWMSSTKHPALKITRRAMPSPTSSRVAQATSSAELPAGPGILSGVASGGRGLSTRRQFLLLVPALAFHRALGWQGRPTRPSWREQMLELLRAVIILQNGI